MTVATQDDFADYNVGLEDVDATDLAIPRLRINHTEGTFVDSLTKEEFSSLDVVMLGVVKQRIMWDRDVEDDEKPMCKSPDFETGFPQVDPSVPAEKRFPWEKSNFNLADYNREDLLVNGHVALPCAQCNMKEWGPKKSDGKSTPPPCNEQHTYPLMYTPDDGESWTLAIFTTQKSGIKNSRTFLSSFARSKSPLFSVVTRLTLQPAKRGNVVYHVPQYARLDATNTEYWPDYRDTYLQVRDFVRQPPRGENAPQEVTAEEDNTEVYEAEVEETQAPAAAPPAPPAKKAPPRPPSLKRTAPAPAPEPQPQAEVAGGETTSASDEDLPF